jgi:hypothetical protein
MIASQIAGIYAAAQSGPVLLTGDLWVIGRWNTNSGATAIAEGHLPGIAPLYNFDTGEIETIYQRYKILNSGSAEMTNFCVLAIDGDYAICGELLEFGSGQNIAITPYNYDEDIDLATPWAAYALTDGVGLNLIPVGTGYIVKDVAMIKPGKFVIVTAYSGANITSYNVKIVTYTSPLDFTIDTIACDLATLGVTGCRYGGGYTKVAVDIDTLEIAITLNIINTTTAVQGAVVVTIDSETATITDSLIDLDSKDFSPLAGLSAITERCFQLDFSDFFYKACTASFGGINVVRSTNNYGAVIEYKEYTSRTVDAVGVTQYASLSSLFNPSVPPLMATKLTAIGFTPTDGIFDPKFGGVGAFIK